jgi:hypothetical protein
MTEGITPEGETVIIAAQKLPGVIATPFTWREPHTIPRREFLFGRHAVRKFVSATAAAGGTGKTALAMAEGIAFVTNRDLLKDHLTTSGREWYIGLEDPLEEYERRVAAIALHYGISPTELNGGLFLDSGRSQDFVLVRDGRSGIIIAEPVVSSIVENITANEIAHVTVDPFVASHSVSENDNMAIDLVVKQWKNIADETGAAIELVHHIRKLAAGEELTADAARGAKALTDAARSVRLLTGMSKEEAERAGVTERRRYFRVVHGKTNLFLPPDEGTWRQLASVSLDNGVGLLPPDYIQVAATWEWPNAFDSVTTADLVAVQDAIARGDWRASPQATDWAGHAVANVLRLDLEKKSDKAKAKTLLDTWVKNGVLQQVTRQDPKRRTNHPFIVVGERAA